MAKTYEVEIGQLIPDDKNFNRGTDEGKKLIRKSLHDFGAGRSVLIDKDNRIIAGNKTHENADAADIRKVIVVETDGSELVAVKRTDIGIDTKEGRELALADNATAHVNLEWDVDELTEAADDYGINLDDWGVDFTDTEMTGTGGGAKEDDFDEEQDEIKPIAQRGDIFALGEHRLMCGDATNIEDVERLMNGGKADLVLTDPPYGINVVTNKERLPFNNDSIGGGGKTHFRQGIGGGNIVRGGNYMPVIGDETTETAQKSFEIAKVKSEQQIIFGGNYFTNFLPPSRCWIVWDKENGENDFADFEMAWTSFDKSSRLFRYLWNGLAREGSRNIEGIKRMHPTQKPVGLLTSIINKLCNNCETILDLFGGSGTTMIAAEQLGRKCYMMELDPHYCDVIIARWEKLTGGKATKL